MWPSGQLKVLTGKTANRSSSFPHSQARQVKTVNCSENWRRCWDRTGKEKGPSRGKKYHVEEGNELFTNNKKRK